MAITNDASRVPTLTFANLLASMKKAADETVEALTNLDLDAVESPEEASAKIVEALGFSSKTS